MMMMMKMKTMAGVAAETACDPRRWWRDDPGLLTPGSREAVDDRGQWSYLGQPAESSSRIIWQTTHGPQNNDIRQSLQIDPCTRTNRRHKHSIIIIIIINSDSSSSSQRPRGLKKVGGQEVVIIRHTAANFRQRRYRCSQFQFCRGILSRWGDFQSQILYVSFMDENFRQAKIYGARLPLLCRHWQHQQQPIH